MKTNTQIVKYILSDFISAAIAWIILFVFRKFYVESIRFDHNLDEILDKNFYLGLFLIPLFWIAIYLLSGHYTLIWRRHRIKELSQVFFSSLIGVLIIFFIFLLDDHIMTYKHYYLSFIVLFSTHFSLTFLGRLILTSRTVAAVQRGDIGFKTIIVGGNEKALAMFEEIVAMRRSPGFLFAGFVRVNGNDDLLSKHMPYLGKYDNLPKLVKSMDIEEVIIAVESGDHKDLENILSFIENLGVRINIIPDMFDILTGTVKMNSIYGVPLIRVSHEVIATWQLSLKRIMDIVVSVLALIVLSPFMFIIAILIILTSKGPVFYSQERIGRYAEPFMIYKFRTMVVDAEKDGPQLSSSHDKRITTVGRFLRKTRMDEIPQFFNVLIADMSLVGPRPERKHFIELISQRAPHYSHLHRVRPGITSWGQVKYGYAENVDQMIQRLKYDILYIENMSLAMDLKILFYTVAIVLKGSGK